MRILFVVVLTLFLMFMWVVAALAAFPTVAAPTVSSHTSIVTTHNITVPSCSSGKLMLIFFNLDSVETTTWPVGANDSTVSLQNQATTATRTEVRYRFANGSDATIVVTSSGAGGRSAHQVYCVTGAHASQPPERSTVFTSESSAAPNPLPLNPTGWGYEDTLWVAYYTSHAAWTNDSTPSGYATNQTLTSHTSGGVVTSWRAYATPVEDVGAWAVTPALRTVAGVVGVRPATTAAYPKHIRTIDISRFQR